MDMMPTEIRRDDKWRRKYNKYETPWEILQGLEKCNGDLYTGSNATPAGEFYPEGLTVFAPMSKEDYNDGYCRRVILTDKGKALRQKILDHLNTFDLTAE